MQIRQMEYAVAVAEEGSFTSAARALHVTQSALSQGIAVIERELGTPLFLRRRNDVRVTAAGEVFVDAARRVIREVRHARDSVDAVVGVTKGRLDLVVAPAFAAGALGPVLGRFRSAHPGVALHIDTAEATADIQDAVRRGRAELGFAQLPVDASMEVLRTWSEDIWLVRPPGSGDDTGPVEIQAHLDAPLVVPAGAGRQIREVWENAGLEANIAVECAAHELVVPLVLAGAGVAFQPESVARAALTLGAAAQPLAPPITWHTALFAMAGAELSPAARALADIALPSPA